MTLDPKTLMQAALIDGRDLLLNLQCDRVFRLFVILFRILPVEMLFSPHSAICSEH